MNQVGYSKCSGWPASSVCPAIVEVCRPSEERHQKETILAISVLVSDRVCGGGFLTGCFKLVSKSLCDCSKTVGPILKQND